MNIIQQQGNLAGTMTKVTMCQISEVPIYSSIATDGMLAIAAVIDHHILYKNREKSDQALHELFVIVRAEIMVTH